MTHNLVAHLSNMTMFDFIQNRRKQAGEFSLWMLSTSGRMTWYLWEISSRITFPVSIRWNSDAHLAIILIFKYSNLFQGPNWRKFTQDTFITIFAPVEMFLGRLCSKRWKKPSNGSTLKLILLDSLPWNKYSWALPKHKLMQNDVTIKVLYKN